MKSLAGKVVMIITLSGGSGGSCLDYHSVSTEYIISGTGSVQAPVVIIDNRDSEGPGIFSGSLKGGRSKLDSADFTNIMFAPNNATATISDNDGNEDRGRRGNVEGG
jgi:hypothetical protein